MGKEVTSSLHACSAMAQITDRVVGGLRVCQAEDTESLVSIGQY